MIFTIDHTLYRATSDTRVSPQLLVLHSLWKEIAQTTLMVLNSMYEQFIKIHLGVIMVNLALHLQINQVKKEILHYENEEAAKEESF